MPAKVKIKLNRLQWEILSGLLRLVTEQCPIADWNLESYIIADLYIKKMSFWSIFPYAKDNRVKASFSMVQAIAINSYFGATNEPYNMFIRSYLEPQLILNVNQLNY